MVQTRSIDGKTQALADHGCFASPVLVFALAKAEKDLKEGLHQYRQLRSCGQSVLAEIASPFMRV